MQNTEPGRSSRLGALIVLVAIGGSAVGVLIYQAGQSREKRAVDTRGFDIAQAPPSAPSPAAEAAPRAARPAAGTEMLRVPIGELPTGRPRAVPAVPDAAREREKEFLRKYDGAIRDHQGRLGAITQNYYKTHPIVRQVDAEFGKLPRYMEVLGRYRKDRDAYQFARDAIALPEVRGLVSKYLSKPEAWKAGLGMISEALRQPPPKPISEEMKRFFTGDKAMSSYVEAFGQEVASNVPAMISGLPPNADMQAISRLAREIAPQAAVPASVPPRRSR